MSASLDWSQNLQLRESNKTMSFQIAVPKPRNSGGASQGSLKGFRGSFRVVSTFKCSH